MPAGREMTQTGVLIKLHTVLPALYTDKGRAKLSPTDWSRTETEQMWR